MDYDSTDDVVMYCDGSDWYPMAPVTGGGSIAEAYGSTYGWTEISNAPSYHSVSAPLTTLADGRVLACAGTGAGLYEPMHCNIYNPNSDSWVSASNFPTSQDRNRTLFRSALLGDGRVLFCGGSMSTNGSAYGATNTCYTYNPATDSFSSEPPLHKSLKELMTVSLADGRALICGGLAGLSDLEDRCDVFDPTTDSFSQVAPMPTARKNGATALLGDGRVLMCGGYTFDTPGVDNVCNIYNPTTNSWAQVADYPEPLIADAAVA